MNKAKMVLDIFSNDICQGTTGTDNSWNGKSGTYKYELGRDTLDGTENGVIRKVIDETTGTVKTAGSFKISPEGNILRFTGVARKVQLMLESKANAQYIAEQTPVEVVEDSVA